MTRCACLVLAASAAVAASPAQAAWSPAELVSATKAEQALAGVVAPSVSVSADGAHVVFLTLSRNLGGPPAPPGHYYRGGIYEADRTTGQLVSVAPGALVDDDDPDSAGSGAQAPSTSADGRYVAFTTDQGLVAADDNDRVDVYVRDMTVPQYDAGAFTLASSPDGSDGAADYRETGGAVTPARTAISADGRRVVFITTAPSDLPAATGPDPTPAGQVLVRDLDAQTTTLVTADRTTGAPAGGASAELGASLSGDGTTVAWAGGNVSDQAPVVAGELGPSGLEYLWRRVADGAGAVTRRVTGSGDPDDPGCPAGGTLSSTADPPRSPCDGPLEVGAHADGSAAGTQAANTLAISRDGYEVALMSNRAVRGAGHNDEAASAQAYAVDMHPGLTRKAALTELTRGTVSTDPARAAPITGIGLSADGGAVAFATRRLQFVLPEPSFLDTPWSQVGGADVFVVDLARRTLVRVTAAADGGQADGVGTNTAPTLSADGSTVAFATDSDNLVPVDGNSAIDAFLVHRVVDATPSRPVALPAPDAPVTAMPAYRLRATAKRRNRRTIAVTTVVPSAGSVAVRLATGSRRHRTVRARGHGSAPAGGRVRLRLRLRLHRVPRARTRARVTVVFTAAQPGRPVLTAQAPTTVGGTR